MFTKEEFLLWKENLRIQKEYEELKKEKDEQEKYKTFIAVYNIIIEEYGFDSDKFKEVFNDNIIESFIFKEICPSFIQFFYVYDDRTGILYRLSQKIDKSYVNSPYDIEMDVDPTHITRSYKNNFLWSVYNCDNVNFIYITDELKEHIDKYEKKISKNKAPISKKEFKNIKNKIYELPIKHSRKRFNK